MAHKKVTSAKVAKQASAALRDGRSSARPKSAAGSALAQSREKQRRVTATIGFMRIEQF